MAQSAPLVLVDGSSYLYRAFFAMSNAGLTNSKGQPTGAARTVTSMLRKLARQYPKSVIAVVFDAKGKTFRDAIFPEYKANRPPMPEELAAQVEPIHAIVKAMGMPLLVVPEVEADDVIGTLSAQATEAGHDVVVSTGDKDMAQLVNAHVTLVNTMDDSVLDVDGVQEKFGIPPKFIIDYLALMGDSVDNIPGVPGVGQKTALALIQGLGGLTDIYAKLDEIKALKFRGSKSMAAKLEEYREQADLSYELATIKTDVKLDTPALALKNADADREQLRALFIEMEFRSFLEELDKAAPDGEKSEETAREYHCITTRKDFDEWIKRLRASNIFAFDTETTGLDYMQAEVVGVSFCVEPGEAAYLPFAHDYEDAPEQLDRATVLDALRPLLEDPALAKVGQNLKFDRNVLLNHDIALAGIKADTMLASYVVNSTATRHDMDSLALAYLGESTTSFESIAGKGAKQLTFNQVPLDVATPYAAEDADITLRLHQFFEKQLTDTPSLKSVYEDIEVPLVRVLSTMERHGALLDCDVLRVQSEEHQIRIEALEAEVYALAGETFNLGSPKQLGHILFDKLGLPVKKKTKSKAPSTAEDVLQELALDYPLPALLLEYRSLSKLKSTYTDKLPTLVNPDTGRLHTSYHQAVAATGRLSSSDPNLQNIPIKTEAGRRVRTAFVAPVGYKIVAADYSQIELRIMAHLSGDENLCRAFDEGLDIHRATASEVFDTELDQVSSEQRRSAKAINFGLIYGMSAFGLSKQLGIGRKEAQRYIDTYFDRYPGVLAYMERTRQIAAEQGFVETVFGRRLHLPDINSSNFMQRQAAERTAINAPMQGTAADIIKRAMISVQAWLDAEQSEASMIMQVHDELVFEVPSEQSAKFSDAVCQRMADAAQLAIPLVVDAGCGDNWEEAH